MPRTPYRPDSLALRVFRGSDAVHAGLLTPDQLRSSAWARLRYDVYADSRLDNDHTLACRAVAAARPDGTVIAGPSAAFVHGVQHAVGARSDVHTYAPRGTRLGHRVGVHVHAGDLAPGDIVRIGGVACTSALRTAWDVGRWFPDVDSVPVIDSLIGLDHVPAGDLNRYARERMGQRGALRASRAIGLTDGKAQSRPESELRVRFVRAGLPKPVAQFAVVLPGGLVLHPDLAWEEYKVAAEYDGAWHATTDQLHRDRRRLNLLVGAGWIVLHVTSQRMRHDFPGIAREVRAALMSRGWRPRSR